MNSESEHFNSVKRCSFKEFIELLLIDKKCTLSIQSKQNHSRLFWKHQATQQLEQKKQRYTYKITILLIIPQDCQSYSMMQLIEQQIIKNSQYQSMLQLNKLNNRTQNQQQEIQISDGQAFIQTLKYCGLLQKSVIQATIYKLLLKRPGPEQRVLICCQLMQLEGQSLQIID